MKSGVASVLRRFGRGTVATLVCALFIVVPVVSFSQIGHAFQSGPARKATALPTFQTRAIDASGSVRPFAQPLVSVTFDDGWESVYEQALPLLQRYGLHTTQYVLSGVEANPLYMSWDQIGAMQQAGHEIACHSATHPDLTTLNNSDLNAQLTGCLQTLTMRYGSISSFASPYGSQDSRTLKAIGTYFVSQRNTDGDISNGVTDDDVNVANHFDPINIIGVTVRRDTTVAQLQTAINYTKAHNGWLVLTYHQADEDSSQYGLDVPKLKEQLEFLSRSGVRVATVGQVMHAYRQLQKGN